MGWRRRMRAVVVGFVVIGCVRMGEGQAAGDTVYSLHGTVVDGVTGKPVARALVESIDQRLATLSDGEGRFSITLQVPEGAAAAEGSQESGSSFSGPLALYHGLMSSMGLRAEKPGYLSNGGSPFALGSGLSETDITLKLMPSAVIAGRVSATGTDAAGNVGVTLFRRQVTADGRYQWQQIRASVTNSRGEYRFADMAPGQYTVATMEWDGEQPLQRQRGAVIVVYPPVFNGGARSFDGSAKLQLGYGSAVQADLQIEAVPFYPVAVPVPGPGAGGVYGRLVGAGEQDEYSMNYDQHSRAMEAWLPDGHYTLLVSTGGDKPMTGLVAFSVAGRVLQTRPIALAPSGKIAIRVHDQRTKPEPAEQTGAVDEAAGGLQRTERVDSEEGKPPPLIVSLIPDSMGGRNGGNFDVKTMSLVNVDPGRYFVQPNVPRGYVAAMSSGGVDLLRDALRVNASGSAEPIDVTLRDDAGSVTGKITAGDAPLPQVSTVFFMPAEASGQVLVCVAGYDGVFTAPEVVPGSYRVFAMAGAPRMLPYREEEGMRPFAGKGVALQVAPNQAVETEVPLLDTVGEDNEGEARDVTVE